MMDFRDSSEIAAAIADGSTTAVAETKRALDRIEAEDTALGAFVLHMPDRALKVAKVRDAALEAGLELGPLHGVPIAIKDLFDLKGYRTGSGSLAFPDHIAADTARSVSRLEAAGAVIVGKTHMVEFAFGGWGTNPVLGTPRNPHDPDAHRVTGGSSSGSGAAVAAGFVPLAIGSDTGGSVRTPAALCGVVGYKTSPGLIDRTGIRYLSRSHDTIGPLCRSVRDAAVAVDVMSGLSGCNSLAKSLETEMACAHVAVIDDPAIETVEPPVREVFDSVLRDFEALGFKISRFRMPMAMEAIATKAGLIMSAESYAELRDIMEAPDCGVASEIVERVRRGQNIGSADYIDLLAKKKQLIREFNERFRGFDALVAPTAPFAAPRLHDVDETRTPLSTFGRFVNMLDMCAISIPAGRTAEGLPIGVQIAAASGYDARVLRLARVLEIYRGGFKMPPRASGRAHATVGNGVVETFALSDSQRAN